MRHARSIQGVPVRLTAERWEHICMAHGDMDGKEHDVLLTVQEPDRVLAGDRGEFLAVRLIAVQRWMVVVYRISGDDGFVITAYRVSREGYFRQRRQLWP